MGRIAAPYGVRGWVKVQPFTEWLDSLLDYPVWRLGRDGVWQTYTVLEGRPHGRHLAVHFEGVDDRDAAERLRGREVAVLRAELPQPEEGEYYWDDLIGLAVLNTAGVELGRVVGLLETGAHDVLRVVAERERLIPFTAPIVLEVDLAAGVIRVDWELDY
ncbi:MAG: ribosome maturation factor RimM [Thiobacillaceae bacterium]|nr:ribosome maturation factor RimM [Thiobacillaceae bacterium]MCX7673056.1 ribosome maturation factor RimM [Thiobacillaceae bacterium]MDW8323191.1 ribosome maturation factor RimM [Burkholderiales bacterium]